MAVSARTTAIARNADQFVFGLEKALAGGGDAAAVTDGTSNTIAFAGQVAGAPATEAHIIAVLIALLTGQPGGQAAPTLDNAPADNAFTMGEPSQPVILGLLAEEFFNF